MGRERQKRTIAERRGENEKRKSWQDNIRRKNKIRKEAKN
jgi:hypothetical protein